VLALPRGGVGGGWVADNGQRGGRVPQGAGIDVEKKGKVNESPWARNPKKLGETTASEGYESGPLRRAAGRKKATCFNTSQKTAGLWANKVRTWVWGGKIPRDRNNSAMSSCER